MDDVDHEEHDCLGQLNLVTIETVREDHQVEQDEDCLTSDDPPVNQSSSGNNQVEYAYTKNPIRPTDPHMSSSLTLDDQRVESCLLDHSRNTNIRNPKENRVHDNKGLSCRISHG